jgi:hypothetical protein
MADKDLQAAAQAPMAAYGGVLVVVGLVSAIATGLAHWTALIPAILGAFALVAWVALRQRLIAPGVAVIVALLVAGIALMGTLSALPSLGAALMGSPDIGNPAGVIARATTAILSVAFVATLAVTILKTGSTPSDPGPRV